MIEKVKNKKIKELSLFAKTAYAHFKSDYLQTKFSYLKRNIVVNAVEIKKTIEEEKKNTMCLLSLLYQNACIGFETSNHYFYTDRNLIEKLLLLSDKKISSTYNGKKHRLKL